MNDKRDSESKNVLAHCLAQQGRYSDTPKDSDRLKAKTIKDNVSHCKADKKGAEYGLDAT